MTNQSKQEFYRAEYKKVNPSWRTSLELYIDAIDKNVGSDTRVLDIGCGHANFLKTVYSRTLNTYGIEPDKSALEKNEIIQNKIVGTADKLPFEDGFFDVVVSAWVLEHLKNPLLTFKEIHRVLKPGGKVIFLTPNAWNFNVWMIRMVPENFHDYFTRKLYNRQENDTYPKQYKINTPRRIHETLGAAGLRKHQIIMNGDPSYISFNKPLFKLSCLIEKMLDNRVLKGAKVHIIGVYEK